MKTLTYLILVITTTLSISLKAQNIDNHLFVGQVLVENQKEAGVKISVIENGELTSSFVTKHNGKFSFIAEVEKIYTLKFEKEGHQIEQVFVSTNDTYHLSRYPKPYELNLNLKKLDGQMARVKEDARFVEYNHYLEKFTNSRRIPINNLALVEEN